jgi:predicted ATPase
MADQVTTGRFVGRTQELAWLRQLLARAATGEPLVALVGGEAGVGKTRLVEQLAATAGEQGVRVLGGGCVPLGEEGLPFAPVVEALRGLADELDADELEAVAGPARPELARLLPDLAWGGEAAAGTAVAADAGQGQLFERLLGMLQRLAATAPLLWVMEDLHWADRSTRDLLPYLATSLRSGRVMVVLTFRSDELDRLHPLRRLLAELTRNRRVVRLELPRFSRAELAEQLAGLLGADPPARLVDDIYARSQGNPSLPKSGCRSALGCRVRGQDRARARHFALGKPKRLRRAAVAEEPFAAAHDNWVDHQPILVDEVVLHQRLHEPRAADHVEVSAVLLLQREHGLCDIARQQR